MENPFSRGFPLDFPHFPHFPRKRGNPGLMMTKSPRYQGSLALIALDWHRLDTYLPTCARSMIGISHLLRSVSLAFARVAGALVQLISNLPKKNFKNIPKISSYSREILPLQKLIFPMAQLRFYQDPFSASSISSAALISLFSPLISFLDVLLTCEKRHTKSRKKNICARCTRISSKIAYYHWGGSFNDGESQHQLSKI